MLKVYEGKRFTWGEFLLHLLVSGVAGVIAYQLLHYLDTPADLTSALCGISGWMGTRMMRIFELLFLRRIGVDSSVLNDNQKDSTK